MFGSTLGSTRGVFALTATLIAGLLSLALPQEARACGGFFCSFSAPVNQAAERILFAVEGEDVTAHIQINYQGDAADFSWVLPLPTVPEMDVGSDLVFDRLHQLTDPRFFIEWQKSDCEAGDGCMCEFDDADLGAGGDPSDSHGGVEVLAEGSVGPFDYKVVSSKDPEAMFTWLNDNGYDQPDAAQPLIEQYVEFGFVFLALKLQKDKDAGEVQPIVIKYQDPTLACIPIKLTSIAAEPNMPIYNWVLAKARAVPVNYFHVVLNAKAYDWVNCAIPRGEYGGCGYYYGGNADCQKAYMELVTEAANAAAGRAFVTEYAGPSEMMKDQLWKEGQYDIEALREQTDAALFLRALLNQGFPRTDLVREIIRKHIPKPDDSELPDNCKGDRAFYSWNLEECIGLIGGGWTFAPSDFVDDLLERVVKPLEAAQALFDKHPYLTRTFTTMSADEMIRDPVFSFNPDLPDVSNEHTAKAKYLCGEDKKPTAVELTFPDGTTAEVAVELGEDNFCGGEIYQPSGDATAGQPAAAEVQMLEENGGPIPVSEDEIADVDEQLDMRIASPGRSEVEKDPNATGKEGEGSGTFGTPKDEPAGTGGTGGTSGTGGTGAAGGTGASGGTGGGGSSGGLCSATWTPSSPAGVGVLVAGFLSLLGMALRRRRRG